MVTLDFDAVSGDSHLMFAELGSNGIAYEDTALRNPTTEDSDYAGAVHTRRRWVARAQQRRANDLTYIARVAYSDTIGIWHEVEPRGPGTSSCTIAPVSDSVALLAHSGGTVPLQVVTLTNGVWTDSALADPRPGKAIYPRFTLRPSGGHWLGWSTVTSVRMSSNQSGEWVLLDVLSNQLPPFETFAIGPVDLSRDGRERPVVVWGGFGSFRDIVCVAFPTTDRWLPPVEVPGSENHYLEPTVARDLNGDVWIAWQVFNEFRVKWTHTYVSATTTKPKFSGPQSPVLTWALSEKAPESRWTLLRAIGSGGYDSVGTVIAHEDTLLSLADPDAPTNSVLRYRVRRESVNKRYEWLSEEATWWPKKPRLQVASFSANPARDALEFEIEGASAGELDVRVYDVQGREVWRERPRANGTQRDRIRMEFARAPGPMPSGLYFVRVADAAGQASASLKTVVIR